MNTMSRAEILEQIEANVREQVSDGDGIWLPCSGCFETEDGQNVHGYPYSEAFGCVLGSGCSECGGIGAIWDTTYYGAMADDLLAAEWIVVPHPKLKRDYPGRDVRTTRQLDTSIASVPAGTVAKVEARPNIGTVIKTLACDSCGVSVRVARLQDKDLQFVEKAHAAREAVR